MQSSFLESVERHFITDYCYVSVYHLGKQNDIDSE